MGIETTLDIGTRVHHPGINITGLVVGIHKDRSNRVRFDVEYRDARGVTRTTWCEARELVAA